MLYLIAVLLAPVLAPQHSHTAAQTVKQSVINKMYLIGYCNSRKSILGIRTDHDIVQKIYRQNDRLLQYKYCGKRKIFLQEIPVCTKPLHC